MRGGVFDDGEPIACRWHFLMWSFEFNSRRRSSSRLIQIIDLLV